jgi:hypothetical protein
LAKEGGKGRFKISNVFSQGLEVTQIVLQPLGLWQTDNPRGGLFLLESSTLERFGDVVRARQVAEKFSVNASSHHPPSQPVSSRLNPSRPKLFITHDSVSAQQHPIGRWALLEEGLYMRLR